MPPLFSLKPLPYSWKKEMDRGSKATLPLTIPHRVFKSSAKDSTHCLIGIVLQGGLHDAAIVQANAKDTCL
ncbi:hypothetical protein RHMOL_Rhmol11G0033100 [Rhododendron molle]|uniref:Uncharacterized protein n=1 Tax=Rhododendron molle TaxID=49168 RepID=A0ACC0LP30_RHOML|nr:hypothetical protein RHMOL_Rhmol11G0033100 [Rhododendron molle]